MGVRTDYLGRDTFTWWVGEVEEIRDPSELGRIKVRILGWYTGNSEGKAYLKEVPPEILPWATVLLPTDQPQTKSAGTTTELQPGAWVLGFFLDGEEGQLPCVLGAFRGFQQLQSDGATTIADATAANELKTDTPQQTDLTNVNARDGSPFPKNENTPASPEGEQEESRGGGINMAEAVVPGNAVSNPIKPPVNGVGIADGVAGPAGKGFEKDMTRMLTELGEMAAAMSSGPGGFVSMITGNKMAGDKVREKLGTVMNFMAGGISGILAPLKEIMAKLIAEVVGMVVKIVSSFVPLIVVNMLMTFLEQIFALFCAKMPMWLGLVKSALSDTANFANQMASLAVDKIATSKLGKTIDSAVKGISNRVLSGITNAMNRVKNVAGDVISAVSTAKGMLGKAKALGDTVQSIFEFDFTELDWGSLLQILLAILGALFKKSCNRKIKRPKSKSWFPLIGTTTCDNIDDAIKGTPYEDVDNLYNPGTSTDLTTLNMSATPTTSAADGTQSGAMGSYIDQMFKDTNPYLMQVSSHLNGTRIIDDATPKKEKRVVVGPGGVSTFEDKFGNRHTNVPNNDTKIISRDKCEVIEKNYALTVQEDLYIKVMGNFHLEVEGTWNTHVSQGPQAEAEGSSKTPDLTGSGDSIEAVDTNVTQGTVPSDTVAQNQTFQAQQAAEDADLYVNRRDQQVTKNNVGGFYPVHEIPFDPRADAYGRTQNGPKLSGGLTDSTEQKSSARFEGDRDVSIGGEFKHQAAKSSFTGIESLMLNSQNIKVEGNTIENIADGEIINQANWISSFLNSGRFEFIALFGASKSLTGQFSMVKGCIVDITTDTPFPGIAPPTQVRISVGQQFPSSMADILAGTQNSFHATFIQAPTGVIAEFVPQGAIINQCNNGLGAYVVNNGYMAVGCAAGPCQVFGLPVLLN
tara:strand:+ start:2447 stop:5197 length:2751 start_codon:yes stop_codon:yes gene_type:complete